MKLSNHVSVQVRQERSTGACETLLQRSSAVTMTSKWAARRTFTATIERHINDQLKEDT